MMLSINRKCIHTYIKRCSSHALGFSQSNYTKHSNESSKVRGAVLRYKDWQETVLKRLSRKGGGLSG